MKKIFTVILLLLLSNIVMAIPNLNFDQGTAYWTVAGSNSKNYVLGTEKKSHNRAFIESINNNKKGFGFMMRYTKNINAYKGKRISMSAYISAVNVKGFAGLWIAPDGKNYKEVGHLSGTTGWKKINIILNVPKNATDLRFGVKLKGSGKVWANNFSFKVLN